MSTIAANLITDVDGTNSPAFPRGELCRARFNLNGTGTIAERDSFNVSSYTDNGTGDYTATFTTAFPNANYGLTGSMARSGTTGNGKVVGGSSFSPVSGSFRLITFWGSSDTVTDIEFIWGAFHGDRV